MRKKKTDDDEADGSDPSQAKEEKKMRNLRKGRFWADAFSYLFVYWA